MRNNKPADSTSKDEDNVVVGRPLPPCSNKSPPPFYGIWNPISYIFFFWYAPILRLVRQNARYPIRMVLH